MLRRKLSPERRSYVIGVLCVLAAMVLWSTVPTATKLLVRDGGVFSPALLSALRLVTASAIFFLLALRYARLQRTPFFSTMHFSWWLVVSAIGLTLNYIFYAIGLRYTTAGATAVVAQVHAPATVLLAAWLLGERLTIQKLIGVLVTMLGILYVMFRGSSVQELVSPQYMLGNGLEVIAALAWPFYAIGQSKALQQGRSQQVLLPIFVLSTIFTLTALPLTGPLFLKPPTAADWAMVAFLGIASTALAYWLFSVGLQRIEMSLGAMLNVLMPLIALFTAHLVLGEQLHAGVAVGFVVVLCGLALIMWRRTSSPVARQTLRERFRRYRRPSASPRR